MDITVTNHSGNPMNNVTVTPDLGDDNDVWPFKTEMQSYQQNIGTLETEIQKMWRLILLREKMFRLHAIL